MRLSKCIGCSGSCVQHWSASPASRGKRWGAARFVTDDAGIHERLLRDVLRATAEIVQDDQVKAKASGKFMERDGSQRRIPLWGHQPCQDSRTRTR